MRTARQAFRALTGRNPGQVGRGTYTPNPQPALDRAALPHYWYPYRDGIEHPPDDFAAKLRVVHPDLAVVRPPARAPLPIHCWHIWYKKAAIQHPLCPGWLLLAQWKLGTEPLPLDDRIFAFLHHCDARTFGSAVKYFDAIQERRAARKAKRRADYTDDLHVRARDFFESTKIKNIGAGNKFALHHDGTIIPSRGEANWSRERLALPTAK